MSGDHLTKHNMSTAHIYGAQTSSSTPTTTTTNLNSSTSKLSISSNSLPPVVASSYASIANHRYVKLNVGGRLFATSIDTLTKQDNMLRAMFSGRMDLITDADGYILIDRCGKHFELILNYLRDEDTQSLIMNLDKSEIELYELLKEAKFYCIQSLVNLIEQKVLFNKQVNALAEPYFGSSVVSMITSKIDLIKILQSTDKPCIRLLINRHNNKYSYTNTSDENLLKNIELFERMAIKFKNRIMFIKDTTSNEEICCWYFHGAGKKLAEVCCTSIVYTTEKKQTKVEFPDSKILEEIFVNAVLFETKDENATNGVEMSNQTSSANFGSLTTPDEENVEDVMIPRQTLNQNNVILVNPTATNAGPSSVNSLTGSLVGISNSTNISGLAVPNNLSLNSNANSNSTTVVTNANANGANVSNIAGVNLATLTSSSSSLVNSVNLISNSNSSSGGNSLRRGPR